MKKLILTLALVAACIQLHAATLSVTLATATASSILGTNGSLRVTQFILTCTNAGSIQAIDSPSTKLEFSNSAYTNTISYVTNLTTIWTNYYGVVQGMTNVALVDIANSNGAVTVSYPIRFTATTPANTSSKFDGVSYYFNSGMLLTNTSAYTETITVTYQQ